MHEAMVALVQLISLYVLAQLLQRHISLLFSRILRFDRLVIWAMAILFLPGTIMHELAHYVAAKLLFVKTGAITLTPRPMGNGAIRMGSVAIAKTDPLRRFLIGVAPVYGGMAILFMVLWWSQQTLWPASWAEWAILGYIVFQITNSMFASSKDMEGATGLFILIALLAGLLYWLRWTPTIPELASSAQALLNQHQSTIRQATQWLWVPIGINSAVLLLLAALTFITKRA